MTSAISVTLHCPAVIQRYLVRSILSACAMGSSRSAIMDISKLPKLSETPAPPPPAPEYVAPVYAPQPEGGSFAEACISIAMGGLLLFVYPNTWHWLLHYNPPII